MLITGSEFELPKYQNLPKLMKEFTSKIELNKEKMHPVELAAWLHERIVSIHPFIDGNGRTARLLMNFEAMKNRIFTNYYRQRMNNQLVIFNRLIWQNMLLILEELFVWYCYLSWHGHSEKDCCLL